MKRLEFLIDPIQTYDVYLSGVITGLDNYQEKFAAAENLIRSKYGFQKIINPVDLVEFAFSFPGLFLVQSWDVAMVICLNELLDYDPRHAIFLRIDSMDLCRQYKSGAIIENYYAIQRGLIICDLIGDEIKLAETDIKIGSLN